MPESESPVIELAQLYRERALQGDEHLTITAGNAIAWKTDTQRFHLICPTDASEGYGLLQIDTYDSHEGSHAFVRYLFNATALTDKVSCVVPAEAIKTLDQAAFDDMMFSLTQLGNEEISAADQDQFFGALFSVPEGP